MTSYREAILKMYNDRTSYDTEEGTQHPRIAQELVDASPLKEGDVVLDVATGTGLVAFDVAKRLGNKGRVIAVDLSDGLLEQARRKLAVAPEMNIAFWKGDAAKLTFAAETFDLIFCCEALVLFEHPLDALTKWHEFLKPSGSIAFTCTHEDSYFGLLLKQVVESVLGPKTPPQMHEILGTERRILEALLARDFRNLRITSKDGGELRPVDTVRCSRNLLSLMFKGDSAVNGLTENEFDHVASLFRTGIKEKESGNKVWQDAGLFFVHASKA